MSGSGRTLRLVHSVTAESRRAHDAEVFRVEQEILEHVGAKQRELFDMVKHMVAERLAPLDAKAAAMFLEELQTGALP